MNESGVVLLNSTFIRWDTVSFKASISTTGRISSGINPIMSNLESQSNKSNMLAKSLAINGLIEISWYSLSSSIIALCMGDGSPLFLSFVTK